MDSKDNSKFEARELENLLHEKNLPTVIVLDGNQIALDSQNDGSENVLAKRECEQIMEKQTLDSSSSTLEFSVWKNKTFSVNKSLFLFRIALFLWFGAGILPSCFIGLFLKQQGLTMIEFSSAFSLIFVFQLIVSFIAGIITDKIGNAKPVLLFLMFSTSVVFILFSLTPEIKNGFCNQQKTSFNNSNISENFKSTNSCSINCLLYFENHALNNKSDSNNSTLLETNITTDNTKGTYNFSTIAVNYNYSLKDNCCTFWNSNEDYDCLGMRREHLVVVYAILILTLFSFWSTTYRFFDFTSLSLALKYDSHLGKERFVGICGELFSAIIIAFVLNIDKSSKINFQPVFWMASGIILCSFLTVYFTSAFIFPPGRDLTKKALSLARNIDTIVFLLLVFVAGNGYSFALAFHLIFLESINAPKILISLYQVFRYLYGLPVLLTNKWWLKKFGTNKLLVLGLLFYTINDIAYSFLHYSWWSLFIVISTVFTFHLFWVAVVVHCRKISPVGFAATLNALTGVLHFGIGRSSGVFFGGMMISYAGQRNAYRIMGSIYFVTAILYSIFIYKRKKSSSSEIKR